MSKSKGFENLGLGAEIVANLTSLGYVTMTPIQEQALPFILEGKDLIGQANTGSGKTAAFGLGLLAKIDIAHTRPQALILCPTRELAEQVCIEIRRLARFTNNIKVLTLCGGTEERHKAKSLEHGAHIIVGTPGRIKKLLEKKSLNVNSLKVLVLDEADRMLELGFMDDINAIASFTPLNRQTLLFSATFPHGIKGLSASLQDEPAQVTVDSQHQLNDIKQLFFPVSCDDQKFEALLRLLNHYKPESTMIFCQSRVICTKLANLLRKEKISALEIHGELEQQDRTLVLTKFSNKSCRVLVATDVASRGLDIKDVSAVVNYDLPLEHDLYVHRIGRTGRAGKEGLSLSLFKSKENVFLEGIADYLKMVSKIVELNTLKPYRPFSLKPSMETIYISAGRKDNIRPGDILGALTKDARLTGSDVGAIRIFEVNSYVGITCEKVEEAIKHLSVGKIKGKKYKVGKA
ncbi:MAG: ATP-dependent RNA helicase DbpA [Candidatus Omnitrophica bacterium]|nr:ATP-dependent RNA helicase DbpA [Candidatus Omnitrophota bacterium]